MHAMSEPTLPVVHEANGLQDFIAISRYARYSPEKRRRETWTEAVRRVRDMHLTHYSERSLADAKLAALNAGDVTPADLAALVEYLRGLPVHINLIQFNPFPGSPFQPVTSEAREEFAHALRRAGFKVTLRHSLGTDIAAACGQLAGAAPTAGVVT